MAPQRRRRFFLSRDDATPHGSLPRSPHCLCSLCSTVLETVSLLLRRVPDQPSLRSTLCPHLLDLLERAPPSAQQAKLKERCEYELSLRPSGAA